MKIQFSHEVRSAMSVATAVAEEIQNGRRPVLLSISGTTFRFEGGVVVRVNMVDLDQFAECWRDHYQQWVVTDCEVRRPAGGEKVVECWDWVRLLELKGKRPWWHPHVCDKEEIQGFVCVFFNNAANDGYIKIDPDYNNEGHYTVYEEVRYRRFVNGDLKRAEREAGEILTRLTA